MQWSSSKLVDDILSGKKYRILLHLLFWLFIYLDEFFALIGITPPLDDNFRTLLVLLVDVLFVYFNLYILLPHLLLKRKIVLYVVASILSLILLYLIDEAIYGWENCCEGEYFIPSVIGFFLVNSGIFAMAISFKLFKHFYRINVQVAKLKQEKLVMELNFLKQQINPHFLFNSLNNLYVLSKEQPSQTPDHIMALSDTLRYQLYESQKDLVSLNQEIEYLEKLLVIEKTKRPALDFNIKVVGDTSYQILPLISLPFIENAIKYSKTIDEDDESIKVKVLNDNEKLVLTVINNIGNGETKTGGIGLYNLKKRLDLVYPGKYTLSSKHSNGKYLATLEIIKV